MAVALRPCSSAGLHPGTKWRASEANNFNISAALTADVLSIDFCHRLKTDG